MVAPFCQPDLVWDFQVSGSTPSARRATSTAWSTRRRLGRVAHKAVLPPSLIFHVSYLGGDMPTLALNFSRPGAPVLLQYYQFLRLGFEGYRRVQQASQDVALHLSRSIAEMGPFELLSDGSDLPVFAWRLGPNCNGMWDLHDLSNAAAGERLAGAGLPDARQPQRHHRSAHRGA